MKAKKKLKVYLGKRHISPNGFTRKGWGVPRMLRKYYHLQTKRRLLHFNDKIALNSIVGNRLSYYPEDPPIRLLLEKRAILDKELKSGSLKTIL